MNFKKIFFSTVLLSLCLFITEGATRILFHFLSWDIKAYQIDGGRYQVEPFRAYGLTPGWELNHESLKETYNSQGFKSPEFTIKKSDDIYRIVVLGGSSVYGNYGNDKTWSQFLNEYLEQKKDISFNKSFEVINTGIPGYNSFHTLSLLINNVLDYNPDLIILYQMWNDFSYWPYVNDSTLYSQSNFNKTESILNKSYLFTSIVTLKRVIVKDLTNEKFLPKKVTYGNNNSIKGGLERYKKNIEIMAMICNRYNIPLIISSQLTLYHQKNSLEELKILNKGNNQFYINSFRQGSDILKDISKKYKKNIFYYNPQNNIKVNLEIMRDHIHPTEKGNLFLANDLGEYILGNINFQDQ